MFSQQHEEKKFDFYNHEVPGRDRKEWTSRTQNDTSGNEQPAPPKVVKQRVSKMTAAEKKQIMDGAHLKNEQSHWNIYSNSFIWVDSTAKKIEDVVDYEETYKRSDQWTKEDIALFLRKYLMFPK